MKSHLTFTERLQDEWNHHPMFFTFASVVILIGVLVDILVIVA